MIFKDKEILDKLNEIERKVNSLIAMFNAERVKSVIKSQKKCGGKNVQ